MAAGDNLLLRRAGGKLQNTDSVFRDQGQERAERGLAVAERQMILLRPAAIVDVQAEKPRLAPRERLEVVVPAQKFLRLRVAEVVPVADDLRRKVASTSSNSTSLGNSSKSSRISKPSRMSSSPASSTIGSRHSFTRGQIFLYASRRWITALTFSSA